MYRYRTVNQNVINELKFGEVYFAPRIHLNDPLDMKAPIRWNWSQDCELDDLFKYVLGKENQYRDAVKLRGRYITEILPRDLANYVEDFKVKMSKTGYNKSLTVDEIEKYLTNFFGNAENNPLYFISQIFENLKKEIDKDFEKMGVLSFTENYTDFKMWSLYADNHRGICLKYNAENIKVSHKINCLISKPKKVTYVDELDVISFGTYLTFNAILHGNRNVDINSTFDFFSNVFSQKKQFWQEESEIRIIQMKFDNNNVLEENNAIIENSLIEEIYLGAAASSDTEQRIRFVSKHYLNQPRLFKMKFNDQAKMTYEEI